MLVLLIFFVTVVSIQLIYFTAFIIALISKDKPAALSIQPVSVIVCAHDEEDNLRKLVPLLLLQQHPQFEVIIVNDRSNDGTYDFLLEETKKNNRLRMVNIDYLPGRVNGKKYGITLAIKAAKYDLILLTDADCRPATNSWISSMTQPFSAETKFVLGYSPYIKESGLLNLFIRFETLITAMQYLSFALLGNPYMGVGRNLAYRKSLFMEVKGFNDLLPLTGGDDDLFVNKYATASHVQVCTGADALTFSIPKKSWTGFFIQKVRHLVAGKRYKRKDQVLLGLFSWSWLSAWVLGIALLFMSFELIWVIPALILRTAALTMAVYLASKRVGHKFETWTVPFLDFLFVIYYISTGTVALVTKKVRWKN